jgi:hypothetical protein
MGPAPKDKLPFAIEKEAYCGKKNAPHWDLFRPPLGYTRGPEESNASPSLNGVKLRDKKI